MAFMIIREEDKWSTNSYNNPKKVDAYYMYETYEEMIKYADPRSGKETYHHVHSMSQVSVLADRIQSEIKNLETELAGIDLDEDEDMEESK